jgi:hypothetical protein
MTVAVYCTPHGPGIVPAVEMMKAQTAAFDVQRLY